MGEGGIECPPSKILESEATESCEGQNGGSWVCPVHLHYFQLADMCISRGFKLKISLIVTFE